MNNRTPRLVQRSQHRNVNTTPHIATTACQEIPASRAVWSLWVRRDARGSIGGKIGPFIGTFLTFGPACKRPIETDPALKWTQQEQPSGGQTFRCCNVYTHWAWYSTLHYNHLAGWPQWHAGSVSVRNIKERHHREETEARWSSISVMLT